jgi:hypothetical protein
MDFASITKHCSSPNRILLLGVSSAEDDYNNGDHAIIDTYLLPSVATLGRKFWGLAVMITEALW